MDNSYSNRNTTQYVALKHRLYHLFPLLNSLVNWSEKQDCKFPGQKSPTEKKWHNYYANTRFRNYFNNSQVFTSNSTKHKNLGINLMVILRCFPMKNLFKSRKAPHLTAAQAYLFQASEQVPLQKFKWGISLSCGLTTHYVWGYLCISIRIITDVTLDLIHSI